MFGKVDTTDTYQWWIASWADDEQYKGKNSLLRLRCSCAWRTCVGKMPLKSSPSLYLFYFSLFGLPYYGGQFYLYRPWSSPQILSGKGANNGQFERGQLVRLILTKAVLACQRL